MSARARRIKRHVANLSSPDKKLSERAEANLIRYYGADAIPDLLPALQSDNPTVRFRAVWILGKTRRPEVFDPILALCDDPDKAVRYDAVMALGELGDSRAIEPLTAMDRLNDPTRPAQAALHKLGVIADEE